MVLPQDLWNVQAVHKKRWWYSSLISWRETRGCMNNNQSLGQVLGVRVYSVIWGNPSRFDFHIMLKFQAHAHSETFNSLRHIKKRYKTHSLHSIHWFWWSFTCSSNLVQWMPTSSHLSCCNTANVTRQRWAGDHTGLLSDQISCDAQAGR